MAESEGFEPPIPVKVCRFSRPVPSTTRPTLRGGRYQYYIISAGLSRCNESSLWGENMQKSCNEYSLDLTLRKAAPQTAAERQPKGSANVQSREGFYAGQ
jgi:hypothetical protein